MNIPRLTTFAFALSMMPFSHAAEAPFKVSQSDFGGTGLMQTPSGRMAEPGEFNLGATINDDYQHYMASLQLLDWLETTVRYTRVPDVKFSNDSEYSGDNLYTDKGIDVKARILNESYWLPETSIGIRDLGGTGLFDGEFIAATKRFGNLDVTLGLGWGYLGQRGNISNPICHFKASFCSRPNGYKGTGGSIDSERWFKDPASVFGGIEYQTPYEPLRIKVEYEGNDYSQDFPYVQGGKAMPQATPWNLGVHYRVSDWIDTRLSYQRGNTLTVGFNFYTYFNHMQATWLDDPKPTLSQRPSQDWSSAANQLAANAGYTQNHVYQDGRGIVVTATAKKYRDRNESLERAATILHNTSGDNIDHFTIIEQNQGLAVSQTHIDRRAFVSAATYQDIDSDPKQTFVDQDPENVSGRELAKQYHAFSYGIEPVLSQSVGAPESFYLYSFGVNAISRYWLTNQLELSGSVYFNLFDNYDKFNYVENSPHVQNHAVPRVRTMFRAYVSDNPVRLNNLQLTWFNRPSNNIYTQAYAGYLETMFAGIGGEVLYRPNNKNWAVGLDANLVSQRDPDSWFGLYSDDYFFYDASSCSETTAECQAYVLSQGTTGHLTGYYMPKWSLLENTLFKVSVGEFLGGDKGARIDFSKQFDSGVIVGAYATITDLTAEDYGEGSYNKGFYISLPLDIMTVKPSTDRAAINWQPITRDGGQMLNKKYQLFDVTDPRSPWSQRPNHFQ
ncbi:YjbH domain-containing protein [Vibrio sp. AK197]